MKKIVIIGSGPGGYYAALKLGKAGLDVTLVDKEYIGGTCLNIGCIPTKTLLDHLSLFEHFKSAREKKLFFCEDLSINQQGLKTFQSEVISQLKYGLEKLFKNNKINFILGEARFIGNKKILVSTKEKDIELTSDEIIIATGSRPKTIPGFDFDTKLILSSSDVWNIPTVPKKLLVIGSGPIGIEFSRIFNALGSEVTVAEIMDTICPILDTELSLNLSRSLKRRNILLKTSVASKLLEKKNNSIVVEFLSTKNNKKETLEFNGVLVAVGRSPNTENLGLKKAGIETLPGGFIKINEFLESSVKNIWAIGDVTNYPQLAHTASYQARIVAENIMGKKKAFKGDLIPSCIFGYPEVAFVGKREQDLEKDTYQTGKFFFLASGKAKASGRTEGLIKVLIDTNTKKILGAHMIGAEVSNLIHEIVIAMQNNLTAEQVVNSIHAHPTYSEVLSEELESALKEAVHV